jgi:hypothetical protein
MYFLHRLLFQLIDLRRPLEAQGFLKLIYFGFYLFEVKRQVINIVNFLWKQS